MTTRKKTIVIYDSDEEGAAAEGIAHAASEKGASYSVEEGAGVVDGGALAVPAVARMWMALCVVARVRQRMRERCRTELP